MARYTGPDCKLCRREGCKLFLKGDKCYGPKCAVGNRPTPPGEHGQARQRKQSEYGLQLREKQKAKRIYGVLETQFHRYFEAADRQKGITGDNLLITLERRLDNVIYRLGFGASRAQARQIIRHGHIRVNGKKVDDRFYTGIPYSLCLAPYGYPKAIEIAITPLKEGEPRYLEIFPTFHNGVACRLGDVKVRFIADILL